jgi:hypothetical protein
MFWPSLFGLKNRNDFSKEFLQGNYAAVAAGLNRAARLRGLFQVFGHLNHSETCEIEFSETHIALRLGAQLNIAAAKMIADRLVTVVPLLVFSKQGGAIGDASFALGDSDPTGGLAFCSSSSKSTLVPDPEYLSSRAYSDFKQTLKSCARTWERRKPIAIWRGTTTGHPNGPDWRTLPRVKLCLAAAERPDLFDVGITRVVQLDHEPRAAETLKSEGLMRPYVEPENFGNFKYQIDIDGNSNAWSGLFKKLLTGSPVLKVASPGHYRQWYYDLLKPFVNYVPVQSDMSDLTEKLLWLRANDDKAKIIGDSGRKLALSLTYEKEIETARHAIIGRVCGLSGP